MDKYKPTILLLVPALLLLGLCWLSGMRSFALSADPSYAYLFNSLLLSEFKAPQHVDHPGTPLQVLGAVVIRVWNLFSGRDEMVGHVLQNPELYLRITHFLTICLVAVSFSVSGYLVFKATNDLLAALLFQITPMIISVTSLGVLLVVNTEPLLMAAGVLLAGVLIYYQEKVDEDVSIKFVWVFGVIAGFGIATKIIFAPVALIPLFVLPRRKSKLLFIAVVLLSTLVFISPILSRFGYLKWWIKQLGTNTGQYGRGGSGFIDPNTYLPSLGKLIAENRFLFATLLGSSLFILWRWIYERKFERLLTVVTCVAFFQLALVAKMPKNSYLVPAFALMGVNFFLAHRILKGDRVLFSSVLVVFYGMAIANFAERNKSIRSFNTDRQRLEESIAELDKDRPVIHYWGSTSPLAALQFGNEWSDFHYGKELEKLYPKTFFYELWNHRYETFAEKEAPPPPDKETFFFRGAPFKTVGEHLKPAGFTLQDQFQGKRETFYRGIPAVSKK